MLAEKRKSGKIVARSLIKEPSEHIVYASQPKCCSDDKMFIFAHIVNAREPRPERINIAGENENE